MGLNKPTGGQILWNGEDITSLSITERAQRGISYGFQQPPRFKGLRVRDLLGLAAGNPFLGRAEGPAGGLVQPHDGLGQGGLAPAVGPGDHHTSFAPYSMFRGQKVPAGRGLCAV